VLLGAQQLALPAQVAARVAAYQGRKIIVGVRPEDLAVGRSGGALGALVADVRLVEVLGSEQHVYFWLDATPAGGAAALADESAHAGILAASAPNGVARVDPRSPVRAGGRVTFAVDPARLYFFDPDTGHAVTSLLGGVGRAPPICRSAPSVRRPGLLRVPPALPRSLRLRLLVGGVGADLRDGLHLDRGTQGQRGDPDGRAGMRPGRAQDVEQQLRGAVSDLRLLYELAGAGDVHSELDQPRHRVKAASGSLQLCQHIHSARPGGILPGREVHLGAEPACRDEVPVPDGDLPGDVDGAAVPDVGLERGDRGRGRRELQPEAGETVCDGAGSFVHLGSNSWARIRVPSTWP
jgi:hypothetical protein